MRNLPHYGWHHTVVVYLLVLLGCLLVVGGALLLILAFTPVPDIASFASRQVDQSTKIYDRTGQVLLYDYNRDAKRSVVSLRDISPHIVKAVLAIEDAGFYEHGGIRLTSILRAMAIDALGGSLSQGGSTITQQVVKNELLTSRKSVVRKINEWILAIKLEQKYSKDQILETYLNNVPFGGTLYGVEAASEAYFGVPAKDVTLAQATYLASMIQAPSYYSPSGLHQKELVARKDMVIDRMLGLGFIDSSTAVRAKEEKVSFSSAGTNTILAPHFVFYILNQLEQKYGSQALISGLRVITTLDADLQARAEDVVHRYALENVKKFGAKNASLVSLDPSTGHILAMVGSRNFFDTEIDGQYNATLSLRQPGSTMKPFVYALALQKGYTRDTVVFDTPTQFSTSCLPSDLETTSPSCYTPGNFDNNFRGPMTFETALAQSINIPAVKVLYLVGAQQAVNFAKTFGLSSLGDPNRYGLTLVLGGGEVRLLDLTSAYGVFANDGVRVSPTGILEVTDAQGSVLEHYAADATQIISPSLARDVSAMLSDAPARVPEYALNSPLSFSQYEVAVKTGTTNDTRDAWTVGYTPALVLGVWVGNNDNTPMVKTVAGFIAVPMWHEIMEYALSKYPKRYFGEPSPISPSVPPMLQGNWRIPDAQGLILPHDLLYWVDKDNPQGPPPLRPDIDPQFPYWEYGVSYWYAKHPELFIGGIQLPVPLTPDATTTPLFSL